jgi:hypothetical protein
LAWLLGYNLIVIAYYQKIILALFLASFGGEIIIYYLKRFLIDPKAKFTIEITGMIERTILVAVISAGSAFVLFVPVIILIRAAIVLGQLSFNKYHLILKREEPALEFQKIRLKSELGITLLSSPFIGILFGLLFQIF